MQTLVDYCVHLGWVSYFGPGGRVRHVLVESPAGRQVMEELAAHDGASGRGCQSCGKTFMAKHADARFCSRSCTERAARRRRPEAPNT